MDSKSIEKFLKMIMSIDDDTKIKVETLENEIANREAQLKKIISDVEANSEVVMVSHSKKLIERIQSDVELERSAILKTSEAHTNEMERLFSEQKSRMLQHAFDKLSIGRWGA